VAAAGRWALAGEWLQRRPGAVAASVYLLALAVRVAFIARTAHHPLLTTFLPGLDDAVTWEGARLLRAPSPGEPRFELMMLSAPLTAYLTAAWQALVGESVLLHRLLWTAVHCGRYLLVLALARRASGRVWAAAAATLLLAAAPALIVADATFGKAGLDLTLLAALLFLITRQRAPRSAAGAAVHALVTATVLVLAFFNQLSTLCYVLPVVALLATERGWPRRRRLAAAAAVVALVAVPCGWFLRRDVPRGDRGATFLPRAGLDLKIGMTTTTESYLRLPGTSPNLAGQAFEARLLAEARLRRPLAPRELDAMARREALAEVRAHPWAVARGLGRKLRAFFGDYEVPTETSIPYLARFALAIGGFSPFGFGVLLCLAVVGAGELARRRPRLGWALAGLGGCLLVTNLVGYVTWRYRLPFYLPVAMAAAVGLRRLAALAGGGAGRLPSALALCAAAAVAFWPPRADLRAARERYNERNVAGTRLAAEVEADLGKLAGDDLATRTQRALRLSTLQHHTRCFREVSALARAGVDDPDVTALRVRYLLWLGDYPEAARVLSAHGLADPTADTVRYSPAERAALRALVMPAVTAARAPAPPPPPPPAPLWPEP
jgi:hypothetical protein